MFVDRGENVLDVLDVLDVLWLCRRGGDVDGLEKFCPELKYKCKVGVGDFEGVDGSSCYSSSDSMISRERNGGGFIV